MKNANLRIEDNIIVKNSLVGLLCRDNSKVDLFENNFDENKIALLIESKNAVKDQNLENKVIIGETRYFKKKDCRIF